MASADETRAAFASLAPPRPLCGLSGQYLGQHLTVLPISHKNTFKNIEYRLVLDHQFAVDTIKARGLSLLAENSCLGQLCISFFVRRQFWQNYQTNFANQTNHWILQNILCSLWDRVIARIMGECKKSRSENETNWSEGDRRKRRKIQDLFHVDFLAFLIEILLIY